MSVVQRDHALHERLGHLARTARMVFVAGLPGTGKSLLIHQLADLAAAGGRGVHLLQWDVARPVFEASRAGRRYPVVDGVTQPTIRRAVGLWARRALVAWERRAPARDVLLGEAPLVGGRLIELAHRLDDEAEPLLASPACRFTIAVPSADVRRHIESERERRAVAARHAREREDAPPQVLRALWRDVLVAARSLGIAGGGADEAYDPAVYRRVFEAVLRLRASETLAIDTILPTAAMSVYDFAVPCADVVPGADEADAFVGEAEASTGEIDRWWVV